MVCEYASPNNNEKLTHTGFQENKELSLKL